ncbi:Hypothetical predicted protein, partial [Lynx pardinus]
TVQVRVHVSGLWSVQSWGIMGSPLSPKTLCSSGVPGSRSQREGRGKVRGQGSRGQVESHQGLCGLLLTNCLRVQIHWPLEDLSAAGSCVSTDCWGKL